MANIDHILDSHPHRKTVTVDEKTRRISFASDDPRPLRESIEDFILDDDDEDAVCSVRSVPRLTHDLTAPEPWGAC